MNKTISLIKIFLTLLLMSCSSDNEDFPNDIVTTKNQFGYTFTRAREEATEGDASQQYTANVIYQQIEKSIVKFIDNDTLKKVFPDYFGGAYTDNEGKLTILIKGNLEDGRKKILSLVRHDDIIIFKRSNYSYQELTDIVNQITANFRTLPNKVQENICSYYLDDRNNKVVVKLYNINDESIHQINRFVLNDNAIEYSKAGGLKDNLLYTAKPMDIFWEFIQPGSVVFPYANNNNSYGSWAFRARDLNDSTKVGMVTACHVTKVNNDSVFLCGCFLGISELPIYTNDADVAFIEITGFYQNFFFILENTLCNEYKDGVYPNSWGASSSDKLSTDLWTPVVGTIVNKRGWTTGLTTGTIQSSNYCCVVDLGYGQYRTIVNNSYASFTTLMGDSGGIVYTYFSNQNKRYTTGVISGLVIAENGSLKGGYYTKANIALARLGVKRY